MQLNKYDADGYELVKCFPVVYPVKDGEQEKLVPGIYILVKRKAANA